MSAQDPGRPEGEEPTEVRPPATDPFAPPAADAAPADPAPAEELDAPVAPSGQEFAEPRAAEPTPTTSPSEATPGQPAGTAAVGGDDWLAPETGTPEPDPVVRTPDAFTPLGTPDPGTGPTAGGAQERAAEVKEQVTDKASEVKEQAADTAAQVKEKAADTAAGLKDTAAGVQAKAAGVQADAQAKAGGAQAKAQEFLETPEGKVAAAFAGGVVASFLLKALGR